MMEKYNVEDLSLLSGGGEYETQDGFWLDQRGGCWFQENA